MQRGLLGILGCVALSLLAGLAMAADKNATKEQETPIVLKHKMKSLSGKPVDLSQYRGKVLLIVNTASECGATPQYEPLQSLHEKYEKQGLAVLGFPCNQFGRQEPGTAQEIAQFCKANYGVSFDMFAKIEVKGEDQAPLYKYLTSKEAWPQDAGPVKWNFEKFLVNREGKVVARFRTPVEPDSPEVIAAVERELARKPADLR